jgi:serine/threonine-protein kinase
MYRFEQYIDENFIGAGGLGEVWLTRDILTKQAYAKKYIRILTQANLTRFDREVRLMYKYAGKPNIVQIISSDLTAPKPYFVMEYCEGRSLADKIGTFDHKQATNILSCMVRALKPIHQDGGIHRDIKPSNILVKWDGREWVSKLSDFGVAQTPTPGTQMTQTPIGTREYFSPEVKAGFNATQAADIYSLGLTVRELITGSREISLAALGVPFRLANLLGCMMDTNPHCRPNIFEVETTVKDIIKSRDTFVGSLISSVSPVDLGIGVAAAVVLVNLFGKKD